MDELETGKIAYSITEFCREISIGRTKFYELLKRGLGPPTVHLGRRTLVDGPGGRKWWNGLPRDRKVAP